MKKVFIYIHQSILKGGVEKVFYNLFNNLPDNEYHITVLNYCCYLTDDLNSVFYNGQKHRYWFYYDELSNNIIKKFFQRVHNKIMPKILPIWLKIHRYDIAIAAQEGMYAKFVDKNIRAKRKLLWIHNDMTLCRFTEKYFLSPEDEKACYEHFDGIACVSESVKQSMLERFGKMNNLHVIYNPIDTNEIDIKLKEKLPHRGIEPLFVCVGRLVSQKGFDRLLPICKKLNDDGFKYAVWILGEGSDREKLERFIKNNAIDNVKLLGNKSNPFVYIKQADWLLCVSRHEGFNMVLHEAMYCECPIITTINAGTKELLGDSEYGIVLDNSDEAIEKGMRMVLSHKEIRDKYYLATLERKEFVNLSERMKIIVLFLNGN
ncbi:MAG TPA: glycosyltransferase [Candidatus Erysipelatoclostridium merdavium]|uniref:Glycosyltransferase n=1 Tax=Candidatus Erysipelatoclostridium merdavium TaxID=2838566 RepID=A0A9D1XKE7_9FIRM|nr:glycosyltransferase [Candidatus Erysipelatoclostridium merdavium]